MDPSSDLLVPVACAIYGTYHTTLQVTPGNQCLAELYFKTLSFQLIGKQEDT